MKERLTEFLSYLGIGHTKFEEKVGLSRGLISKVKGNISLNSLKKITDRYPELNENWLRTGEGEMIKSNHQRNEVQNNSGIAGIQGDENQITNGSNELHKTYLEMLRKKDEQIDRLIGIMENYEIWKKE